VVTHMLNDLKVLQIVIHLAINAVHCVLGLAYLRPTGRTILGPVRICIASTARILARTGVGDLVGLAAFAPFQCGFVLSDVAMRLTIFGRKASAVLGLIAARVFADGRPILPCLPGSLCIESLSLGL
jgi:hypothetical protein